MKGSHLFLLVAGLVFQVVGWAVVPRRFRGVLLGLAIGLDLSWTLWFFADNGSLSRYGFWSLSPAATWICLHLVLVPVIAVELLARLTVRWRWWVRCAGGGLFLLMYGWGLGEAYGPPKVVEVSVSFPDLPPAFEGYRIIHLSDIHAGIYAGSRTVGRWGRAVEALPADLVLVTGDFISRNPEEAERPGQAFEGVNPPDGRIGILGNNDQHFGTAEVLRRLRGHGWEILMDEPKVVERNGQRLVFLGAAYPMDLDEGGATQWKGKPWPEGFRIGICHSPGQWPQLLQAGARLTFAGHTHGGQVNLSPVIDIGPRISPYLRGLFHKGPDMLYVSSGLGMTGLPIRFRCRPEIVRITLHRSPVQ